MSCWFPLVSHTFTRLMRETSIFCEDSKCLLHMLHVIMLMLPILEAKQFQIFKGFISNSFAYVCMSITSLNTSQQYVLNVLTYTNHIPSHCSCSHPFTHTHKQCPYARSCSHMQYTINVVHIRLLPPTETGATSAPLMQENHCQLFAAV